MIREMNKVIFSEYLEMTIDEIKQNEGLKGITEDFIIAAVEEKGKILNGKDEVMRLNILNKNRINKKIFTKDEVVAMLTFFSPLVPIWIDVEYLPDHKEKPVLQLKCSLRLRKPSLLRNQELGHPPFRAILKNCL